MCEENLLNINSRNKMTQRDPFVSEYQTAMDSPARDSLNNIDGCYKSNIFGLKPFANSRRALRSGAEKLSKTFLNVRNTFGNLSQHFRLSSRRRHRHRLSESGTPGKLSSTPTKKKVLGRSPAKLYSPFGIETPHNRDFRISPYMPDTPDDGLSPKHRKGMAHTWHQVISKKRPRALFH